jgi:hypothetical protein
VIQGTEMAVNENEASVQETANTVTGEHCEELLGGSDQIVSKHSRKTRRCNNYKKQM